MANQALQTLLAEQSERLAEYEAAQLADLAAKLALWEAEAARDDAEMRARVHWRIIITTHEPKLTVDATKDRLAVAIADDPGVAAATVGWRRERAGSEHAARTLSIARRRLKAVEVGIWAIIAAEGGSQPHGLD